MEDAASLLLAQSLKSAVLLFGSEETNLFIENYLTVIETDAVVKHQLPDTSIVASTAEHGDVYISPGLYQGVVQPGCNLHVRMVKTVSCYGHMNQAFTADQLQQKDCWQSARRRRR
jgi:hypothetical protein